MHDIGHVHDIIAKSMYVRRVDVAVIYFVWEKGKINERYRFCFFSAANPENSARTETKSSNRIVEPITSTKSEPLDRRHYRTLQSTALCIRALRHRGVDGGLIRH